MIEAAVRYQTAGDGWIKRVAIGGGLAFLAFFVFLPIFTVYGYVLEVIRNVLRGEDEVPPSWSEYDIVDLSINGAKAFVILFAYGIVVGLVSFVPLAVLSGVGLLLGSWTITVLGTLLGGAIYVVGALVLGVVTPIAVGNFVVEDDISAGFDVEVLRRFGTNSAMLKAAAFAILVNIGVSIVSFVLSVTVIGAPVGFVVSFIGLSAVAYIWAKGFADAYEQIYGELPSIPDGPTKAGAVGESADTSAGEGTAANGGTATNDLWDDDATTTAGTPEETGRSGEDADTGDADSDSSTDADTENRWD